jgi:hypothetical protein
VAVGFSSGPCWVLSNARSHSSRHVSLLKSTSTAPDLVPVAIQGALASGDQAKALVRGISLKRTMVGWYCCQRTRRVVICETQIQGGTSKQKIRSGMRKEQDSLIHKAAMVHPALCFVQVDLSFRSGHNNALPKNAHISSLP